MTTPLRLDTSIIRSFAIVAIVNSHMERYYPRPEFALGGLIGLALFFMATGIGLNLSRHTRSLAFPFWYWRRILRIHPPVIVAVLLVQVLLFGAWKRWAFLDYLDNLVFPLSSYHFLTKILVFYVPLYFYVRWNWKRKHLFGVSGSILVCIATAIPDIQRQVELTEPLQTGKLSKLFLWSVFFLMTLLGVWISDRKWLFRRRSLYVTGTCVLTAALLYLATKYAMVRAGLFTEGFLLLYATGILFSALLIVFLSDPRLVDSCARGNRIVQWLTIGLGTISLEVYLVHAPVYIHRVGTQYPFPVNVFAFAIVSISLSITVYVIANRLRAWLAPELAANSRSDASSTAPDRN